MRWILLLFAWVLWAGDTSAYPMRERVCCDAEAGYAFRYPYHWLPPHQYKTELMRTENGRYQISVSSTTGKAPTRPPLPCDARSFSVNAAEAGDDLAAFGDRQALVALTWSDIDYYRDPKLRPHADPAWAPAGITAKLGTADDRCALVVRHGDRVSGIVLRQAATEAANARVLDAFEILAPEVKSKPGATPPKTPPRLLTWREAQTRKSNACDAAGAVVSAKTGKAKPVEWTKAWEVETQHYHITGNTSPQRLAFHAAYFEALFKAYSRVYQPDRLPPYKFEVHIFDKNDEFKAAAREYGFNIGGGPGITGGFFAPGWLSLWVFEESGKLGGDDFTVEHVSAHECSHQFLHVACNGSSHVPTWINEGLAVYFENGIFKSGEFIERPPTERIQRLRQLYEQTKKPLQSMGKYLDHHGHIGPDNYGEVYAMVHYFIFGNCRGDACKHDEKSGCGRYLFLQYWKRLRDGEDGTKAFEAVFLDILIAKFKTRETALAEWDKLIVEYVRKKLK